MSKYFALTPYFLSRERNIVHWKYVLEENAKQCYFEFEHIKCFSSISFFRPDTNFASATSLPVWSRQPCFQEQCLPVLTGHIYTKMLSNSIPDSPIRMRVQFDFRKSQTKDRLLVCFFFAYCFCLFLCLFFLLCEI